MAIPKKGRRTIKLGDLEYGWYIRKKPTYSQSLQHGDMIVAIQCGDEANCVLVVDVGLSRPDNWFSTHQTAITPAMIQDMIATAQQQGWVPTKPGKQFHLLYPIIRDKA